MVKRKTRAKQSSRKKQGNVRSQEFLRAHLAMERPTVQHLYFSKGVVDFFLGIAVGVLIGLVISNIF